MPPDLDDEAVIVTLPAEEGGATITKVEGEGDGKKTVADDPIADLKGQFDSLRNTHQTVVQRLTTTEQQLAATKEEVTKARGEVTSSQLDTVLSGIQAATSEADAAEREYIAAAEAGDFAAQARAQRKISGAEARIQRLTEAKGDLEDQKAIKPAQRQEARQEPRQAQQDPVEAVASTMAPRAAAWIRSNPDCITDKSKNAKMMATHYAALADGLEEGGNDYFARLDAFVNAKPAQQSQTEIKADTTGRRPTSAAASGSGSGGGMNGGGQEVRLTLREKNSAEDGTLVWNYDDKGGKFKKGDPIGVQEMARRKLALTKQGAYDRTYES
jgi:hypothetical protein